jgi:hypothetical protein
MARRHREHDLDPLAVGDALERLVYEVEMRGLHLLAVGQDRGERARGPVHGHLAFDAGKAKPEFRGGVVGYSAALGDGKGPVLGE